MKITNFYSGNLTLTNRKKQKNVPSSGIYGLGWTRELVCFPKGHPCMFGAHLNASIQMVRDDRQVFSGLGFGPKIALITSS